MRARHPFAVRLLDIPFISNGSVVMCKVHAELGETQFCDKAVVFSNTSTETATFTCTGTTLSYHCSRNGAGERGGIV